ncbi:MAG TPA: class I SAM-dependent methyltransferase [Candidatus Sulfotelmatobacter sp.]|jgi:ubiquinone/menaquinone biosynthesis C-methylase UbiE|nr:class I SAM-dependent methyltransferase [Candidatus Sulfotelmatobacter sp.]
MIRKKNADLLPELVALKGKRVLDAGCGDGGLARIMANCGAHVTGIDSSHRQLDKARAAPKVSDEIYLDAVAQCLPFSDASFEVVIFANSLHHVPVPDQPQALAEAARVLASGGILYVSEPLAEGAFFQVTRLIDDETQVRAKALEALRDAARLGLTAVQEITHVNPVRHRDFASFSQRMGAIDSLRDARLAEKTEELRHAFESNGRQEEDGWHFDQPTRINILRKG